MRRRRFPPRNLLSLLVAIDFTSIPTRAITLRSGIRRILNGNAMNLTAPVLMMCACFFGSSDLVAQELPESAKELIQKLDQFEAEQFDAALKQIEEKRKQVVKALEFQMNAETRARNLDSALAIRNRIKELKGPLLVQESEKQAEGLSHKQEEEFHEWVKTVRFETSNGWILKVEDSDMTFVYPDKPDQVFRRRPVHIDEENRTVSFPSIWNDLSSPKGALQIFENLKTGKLIPVEGEAEQKVKVIPEAPSE